MHKFKIGDELAQETAPVNICRVLDIVEREANYKANWDHGDSLFVKDCYIVISLTHNRLYFLPFDSEKNFVLV
jgi:hypothetical protein